MLQLITIGWKILSSPDETPFCFFSSSDIHLAFLRAPGWEFLISHSKYETSSAHFRRSKSTGFIFKAKPPKPRRDKLPFSFVGGKLVAR